VRFTYHCPLRWSDMDVYGHVNNARFLTLYEEARVAMLFDGLPSLKDGVVILRHEIDYMRPVDYRAEPAGASQSPRVRIESWVEEIRPSRFTVVYELFDGDLLASRARTVCVPFDLRAGRPRRLSAAEAEYLRPWAVT
jgi:acyl-CoA thioester hydrolase